MADFREFQKQYNSYLMHHGILGMHWGVRRYQNPDGSLTEAGKKRYQGENLKTISKALRSSYGQPYYYGDTQIKNRGFNHRNAAKKLKGIKQFEEVSKAISEARKDYDDSVKDARNKIYSDLEDPKKFDRFCKDYWENDKGFAKKAGMTFDQWKEWMKTGDGFQEYAETYYLNKYLKPYQKKIQDSWNKYKSGIESYKERINELVGELPKDYKYKGMRVSGYDIEAVLENLYELNREDQILRSPT